MNRLRTDGVKFDGTKESGHPQEDSGCGKNRLRGDPRRIFLEGYKQGVEVAIGGLQKIDRAAVRTVQGGP